jgi:2-polyprenyl-3-methyl-5-hydroxy-6-metoxy-1,4-benzoquinol methylase
MDLLERTRDLARRHPWEQARADVFVKVLASSGAFSHPVQIIDVGAGDGWIADQVARKVQPGSSVVAWDTNYSAADLAELAADAPSNLRFTEQRPHDPADWLLMLDVVEHVEDDAGFVADLVAANLRPGGFVLASVPAWQALYSSHDAALQHFRRYAPKTFRAVLEQAGLRIVGDGGMFSSLLIPRVIEVLRERRSPRDPAENSGVGAWTGGPTLTAALTAVLRADGAVGQFSGRLGVRLPGLSIWAVGQNS